jgi:hypothetical protein
MHMNLVKKWVLMSTKLLNMIISDNIISDDKNTFQISVILMAMTMRQFNMVHITQSCRSRALLDVTGCRHQTVAPYPPGGPHGHGH